MTLFTCYNMTANIQSYIRFLFYLDDLFRIMDPSTVRPTSFDESNGVIVPLWYFQVTLRLRSFQNQSTLKCRKSLYYRTSIVDSNTKWRVHVLFQHWDHSHWRLSCRMVHVIRLNNFKLKSMRNRGYRMVFKKENCFTCSGHQIFLCCK